MKKVAFILDHNLKHYRIPLFQGLSETFIITVIHKGPRIEGKFNFDQIIMGVHTLGPLYYYQLPRITDFDTVVIMQNIRAINLFTITLNPLIKAKIIHWGIGVSSSGGLQKKENSTFRIRNWISGKAHGIAFYSSYPLPFYSKENQEKSLVIGNSIKNTEAENCISYISAFLLVIYYRELSHYISINTLQKFIKEFKLKRLYLIIYRIIIIKK